MAPPSDPDALLDDLAAMVQQNEEAVRPLDDARYVDAHRTFEQASTQQAQIRRDIEVEGQRLVQSGYAPLDVLSVGCGCGMLDRPLLAHLAEDMESFVGVDPNPVAVAHCEQRLPSATSSPPIRIECSRFEDFDTPQRYDLVYCSHVFYYMDDRGAALRQMYAQLQEGGTLVIAHAPKTAMNALAQVFWSEHAQADFFDDDLRHLLDAYAPPSVTSRTIPASIPRTLFSDATPQGTLLLEFLIQAQWAPLPPQIQDGVQAYIDRHTCTDMAGRALLPHPATTFVLRDGAS